MHAHPNNWIGLAIVLATILGSAIWIGFLFDWDVEGVRQAKRDQDILKGRLG